VVLGIIGAPFFVLLDRYARLADLLASCPRP